MTSYISTVYAAPQNEVFNFYIVTCFSAPSLGVFLSILLFNRIGGYNNRTAYIVSLSVAFLACLVSIPIPFMTSVYSVYILLWLIFFFGSFILAPLTGMMLNQTPREGRATANSLATLFYNLFGYFPAPFVFGGVADRDKSDPIGSMKIAMGVITYWSIPAAFFLLIATLIHLKRTAKGIDPKSRNREEYSRIQKMSPINNQRPQRPAVLRPINIVEQEEALSAFGDS